jgi:hypothetical protein
MKSAILAAITCCAITGAALGAGTPPPKKAVTPPAKKTAPVATATKKPSSYPVYTALPKAGAPKGPAVVTSKAPPAKPGVKTTPTRRYYARQQPVRRSYAPQQPTSDRFREIQDALAAKGYLKTPSTGVWDKDSIDAMQRFQQDQKLDATGKLTARSLGALGLGPKTASAAPPSEPPGNLGAVQ